MATKKKTPTDAAATPAKFPARARKKAATADLAPAEAAPVPAADVAAPVEAVVAPEVVVEVPVAVDAVAPSHDDIRARAYAIWRAEGGSAHANWLRAEAELRGH